MLTVLREICDDFFKDDNFGERVNKTLEKAIMAWLKA